MANIAASVILNRAAKTLLDETNVVWGASELLDYLNAGVNAVVAQKPDAYTVTAAMALASGTKQSLPAGGIQILDVTRNMGSDGLTAGNAIRQIERNHIDHVDESWHTATGSAVKHFMADKRNPKIFYIYPAKSGTLYVEIVYAAVPTRLTSSSDTMLLDDIYEDALHAWVVAHALAKNSKRGDINKANSYLASFVASIGAKSQAQFAFAPEVADEQTGAQGR